MFIALDLPDGGAIGCWFDTDTLLGQIRDLNIDGLSRVMFAYREGHLMDASFNARVHELEKLSPGFFVVKENLSSGAFTLIALLDRNVVMASFIRLKRIIRAFSLLAVILFGAYIALLKKAVIRPLSRLVHAIEGLTEGLEDGNPQPIPVRGDECHEIRDVYRALNTMTGELETLKIRVYEEKLMTQNTRMQLFQLQIRPHFFMNALNTILSYAHAGEYELSGKMALCLAAHCRYILYNSRFAAVGEELAHTQNYVDMQNMQHGPRCRYTVQVKEELLDIEIPVLAVQIFVENALKHCRGTARTEISTLMEHVERDGVSLLHILIDDTGGGFDEDILARLNDADRAEQDEKDGIGIENIRRRLQILYGGDAGLMFSNNESGGARVEMYLPVERKKETERP